jgi:hypothetical protein
MPDIPKFHEFMRPLLEVLQEYGQLARSEAIDAVVRKMGLTDEQMAVTQESNGKSLVRGRIGWASSYLRVAGALTGPQRGYFALGPNAKQLLALNRPIKRADLTNFEQWKDHHASKQVRSQSLADANGELSNEDSTPEDLIETGVKLIKQQLASDLLERMRNMDPHAFEGLVLDVLAAMGYGGGSRQAMQGVPRGPRFGPDLYAGQAVFREFSLQRESASIRRRHDAGRMPERDLCHDKHIHCRCPSICLKHQRSAPCPSRWGETRSPDDSAWSWHPNQRGDQNFKDRSGLFRQ